MRASLAPPRPPAALSRQSPRHTLPPLVGPHGADSLDAAGPRNADSLCAAGPHAADSLAAVGISVPQNLRLGATLTEGDVAAIARSAGINVRTASPSAAFGSAKADRFVSSFGGELRTANGDGREARYRKSSGYGEGEDENPGSGKGKGKGKNDRTPTDPY